MLSGLLRSRSRGPAPIAFDEEIRLIDEPDEVEILLEYPGHIHYLPEVQAQDLVFRNQTIGRSALGNCVHASISGRVEEIHTVWSPSSHHVPAVAIRREGEAPAVLDPATAEGGDNDWVERLKVAGVPTPWTLPGLNYREEGPAQATDIRTVVILGAHEEPTVFTSELLLRHEAEGIADGLRRVAELLPGASIWLTVSRRDESWAKQTFGALARVEALPDDYHARIPRHVVSRLAGISIPNTSAYRRHGVAVLPLEYFLAFRNALDNGAPFVSKCVTIAGDDLDRAVTVRLPIGSSIKSVLESQGLSIEDVGRLIVGGPMRGIAQFSDRAPLTHVDGLYLVSPDAVPAEANDPCINCGRCTRACPVSIQVHLVNRFAEFGMFDEARRHHPEACHECGLCAYVCPAERSLVQLIRLCIPVEA